jgi:hypothetical protein
MQNVVNAGVNRAIPADRVMHAVAKALGRPYKLGPS